MAMFKTGRLSLEMGSFFAGMMVSHGLVKECLFQENVPIMIHGERNPIDEKVRERVYEYLKIYDVD